MPLDIGTLMAHIGVDTIGMTKAERKVDNSTRKMRKDLLQTKKATHMLRNAFIGLGGVLTIAGIARISSSVVKLGANFESSMATVRGVMRATDKDFKALTSSALEMGEKTAWSASQSAEALKFMGMAGFTAQQAIEALPGVLNLASAAGIDLGRASDIVTDSLTAMGLGVQDLTRFNDVMVGTMTRSNTNLEMMGESMKYSAPIAKQLGMEVESLAAMIGVLANSGIKASDAGTDLRQAMIRNSKAAKVLGTDSEDLSGTLRAAKDAGWGLNEVVANYGILASKSVLVLMDQIDAYEDLEKTLHNVAGESEALAKIKLDTLTGDFLLLKSTIESVGLASFDAIKGDLRGGVQDTIEYIRNNKQGVVDFVEDIKDMVVSLGPMVKSMAKILQQTVQIVTWFNSMGDVPEDELVTAHLTKQLKEAQVQLAYLERGPNLIDRLFGDEGERQQKIEVVKKQIESLTKTLARQRITKPEEWGAVMATPGGAEDTTDKKIAAKPKPILTALSQEEIQERVNMERNLNERLKELTMGTFEFKKWQREQDLLDVETKVGKESDLYKQAYAVYLEEIRVLNEGKAEIEQEQAIKVAEEIIAAGEKRMELMDSLHMREMQATYDQFELRRAVLAEENTMMQEKYANDEAMLVQWGNTYAGVLAKIDSDHTAFADSQMAKTETLMESMGNAMQGWASSWSSGLNDMLWGADTTFADIAESFAKMITQMFIQKAIIEPFMQSMSGGMGGGGGWGALFSAVVSKGHGGGIVGPGFGTPMRVDPSIFLNAPLLHRGLMKDEFPAILQKGEKVIPKGVEVPEKETPSGGQGFNVIFLMDPKEIGKYADENTVIQHIGNNASTINRILKNG